MDPNKNTYCRFCAEPKSADKLLNLQADEFKQGEIKFKLTFLNASYVNVSKHDSLPKTICFVCYDSLNKSFEFLNGVKRAQGILSTIFIEPECNKCDLSDDDNVDDILSSDVCDDNPSIKMESDDLNSVPETAPLALYKRLKQNKSLIADVDMPTDILTPDSQEPPIKIEDSLQHNDKGVPDAVNFPLEVKPEPKDLKEYENPYANSLYVHDLIDAAIYNNLNSDMTIYAKEVPEFHKKEITSWADYPWVCVYCSIEFINLEMLSTHAKLVHGKCSAFYCIDCKVGRKDDFLAFVKHVRKHRKCLRNYCYYCYLHIEDLSELKVHIKQHYIKPQIPCPLCGEIQKNEDALKLHIRQFSAVKQKRRPRRKKGTPITIEDLTCNHCKKIYKNPNSLRDHMKLHTKDRKKDYTCDRCGKMFYNKGTLTSHIMSHDKIRPHVCRICNKSFLFPNMLRRHVEMHSGVKPFSCEQCGRCFRLQYQLNSHKIIHTDLMPYVCSYCSKAFRFKQILKNHERQHTGSKPYTCENCGMEFTNWSNYNKHMKRRHNTDTSKKKITPEGVFPINPETGQLVQVVDPIGTEEWKTRIMVPSKRGKKKVIKQESVL